MPLLRAAAPESQPQPCLILAVASFGFGLGRVSRGAFAEAAVHKTVWNQWLVYGIADARGPP